jgi:hypothetical protein
MRKREATPRIVLALLLISILTGVHALRASASAQYVYVTVKPNNQQGILYPVNVTAFDGPKVVDSGVSNTSGIVRLADVPFGNITFVAYAKSDYSQVIANATVLISEEGQSLDLVCDQNYSEASISWNWTIVVASSIFAIPLPLLLLGFRMRIKKSRRRSESHPLKGSWQVQFPRRKAKRRRVRE